MSCFDGILLFFCPNFGPWREFSNLRRVWSILRNQPSSIWGIRRCRISPCISLTAGGQCRDCTKTAEEIGGGEICPDFWDVVRNPSGFSVHSVEVAAEKFELWNPKICGPRKRPLVVLMLKWRNNLRPFHTQAWLFTSWPWESITQLQKSSAHSSADVLVPRFDPALGVPVCRSICWSAGDYHVVAAAGWHPVVHSPCAPPWSCVLRLFEGWRNPGKRGSFASDQGLGLWHDGVEWASMLTSACIPWHRALRQWASGLELWSKHSRTCLRQLSFDTWQLSFLAAVFLFPSVFPARSRIGRNR